MKTLCWGDPKTNEFLSIKCCETLDFIQNKCDEKPYISHIKKTELSYIFKMPLEWSIGLNL